MTPSRLHGITNPRSRGWWSDPIAEEAPRTPDAAVSQTTIKALFPIMAILLGLSWIDPLQLLNRLIGKEFPEYEINCGVELLPKLLPDFIFVPGMPHRNVPPHPPACRW